MIEKKNASPDSQDEIDALLRDTLRDDLPAEVEARLERRVQRFVASRAEARRRPGPGWLAPAWAPSQRMVAVAASLLLACGFGLQARSGPDGLVESLSDVSAAVTLARVVRGATSVTCTGFEDAALASPAALADRIYRRWVLMRWLARPDGTVMFEFLAEDERAVYELVSSDLSQPPREIRKRPVADAARREDIRQGSRATCAWEVPPEGTPGIAFMLGR